MSSRGIKLNTDNKVQQQFKDECNVGNIVERFVRTGVPPRIGRKPMFLDLTQVGDFTEMLNHVTAVNQEFMMLPAKTRSEFKNDPAELLKFLDTLGDKESVKRALSHGLISQEQAQDILKKTSAPNASQVDLIEESEKSTKSPPAEEHSKNPELDAKIKKWLSDGQEILKKGDS